MGQIWKFSSEESVFNFLMTLSSSVGQKGMCFVTDVSLNKKSKKNYFNNFKASFILNIYLLFKTKTYNFLFIKNFVKQRIRINIYLNNHIQKIKKIKKKKKKRRNQQINTLGSKKLKAMTSIKFMNRHNSIFESP